MLAKKIVAGILAIAMAFSLTACSVNITTLLLPEILEIEAGDSKILTLEYAADDNSDADALAEAAAKLTLTWASSDESVATVDAEGEVTALAPGECEVTVATEDGKLTATCRVVVLDRTVANDDDMDTQKLAIDSEGADALEAIKATGVEIPEEISADQLTWTSSDESVATVDANGHVTPVSVGTCVITATGKLADGQDWTAQCGFSIIQETVDEEPAAETTDKDSSKNTGKTDGKTDSNKNDSTATGGENVSVGNNTPAPTPAPAPDPTPVPDTGNNSGNTPPSGGIVDGGLDNVIPGGGITDQDGGDATPGDQVIPPEPAPETNTPPSGGIVDGGLDNVIPGGGITDQDGGDAVIGGRPDPAPVE